MRKTFSVIEYLSGFAIRHNPTLHEVWMGDGVDYDYGTEETPLTVGMDGFREAWENDANGIYSEYQYLECYFPDLYEGIYGCV